MKSAALYAIHCITSSSCHWPRLASSKSSLPLAPHSPLHLLRAVGWGERTSDDRFPETKTLVWLAKRSGLLVRILCHSLAFKKVSLLYVFGLSLHAAFVTYKREPKPHQFFLDHAVYLGNASEGHIVMRKTILQPLTMAEFIPRT